MAKFKTDHLTDIQKYVCLHNGTEQPFENDYWDMHEEGIYVDVISGEVLFTSADKFDSGSGWPSFTKPYKSESITAHKDTSLGVERIEIRASNSDAHLGHVFPDGPKDKGGLRFCINSASLRFIPKNSMEDQGYGDYLAAFDT